jgi:hypothetical protein
MVFLQAILISVVLMQVKVPVLSSSSVIHPIFARYTHFLPSAKFLVGSAAKVSTAQKTHTGVCLV